jgi:hypothetical protein
MAAMSPRALRAYHKLQQQRYAEACTEIAAAGGHVWAKDSASSADTPEQLDHVSLTDGLPVLEAADVARAKVYMSRFPSFRLDLGQRELGPGAFAEFSGLRNVRALSASKLGDADLQWMIKLPGLEWLGITGRQITDRGIASLRLPPHVRALVAGRTSITPRAYPAGSATQSEYGSESGPIEAGDLILCRASSGPKRADITLALDHAGRERFRVAGPVVSAVTEGDGWVFLMPDGVRRVRPDGSIAWSVPGKWAGTRGQLLRCPEGDVISLTYNASGDAYQLARVNCSQGALVWRYTSPVRLSNHFIYVLEARMELRRGLLAVTEDGTGGMYIAVFDSRTGEARFEVGVPRDPAPPESK